ncbi:MAG: hypothetical protein LUE91_02985, partial [Oscillospiraceae bacterium]|nr:hypothetical protein [Oscillospiraceae bacterium]
KFPSEQGAKVQAYCSPPSPGQHSCPGDGFSVALVQNHCKAPQSALCGVAFTVRFMTPHLRGKCGVIGHMPPCGYYTVPFRRMQEKILPGGKINILCLSVNIGPRECGLQTNLPRILLQYR